MQSRYGYPVNSKTVTIPAARCRSLFSSPYEVLPAIPGIFHVVVRAVHSHPSGTPPTFVDVVLYGLFWHGVVGAAAATGLVAFLFPGNGAAALAINQGMCAGGAAYGAVITQEDIPGRDPLVAECGAALEVRTTGADLGGASTYDMTTFFEYVELPLPWVAA